MLSISRLTVVTVVLVCLSEGVLFRVWLGCLLLFPLFSVVMVVRISVMVSSCGVRLGAMAVVIAVPLPLLVTIMIVLSLSDLCTRLVSVFSLPFDMLSMAWVTSRSLLTLPGVVLVLLLFTVNR